MTFKNLVIGVIILLLEITTDSTLLLFSLYVVSDSLGSHGLQSARFPCPSLSPGVCSNSCPLSQWCYLTITSSATLFFFCPQSFPAFPQSFLMSQLLINIRWPKYWSFSISPSSEYSGLISFRINWFDLLAVQGTQESSPTPQSESINSTINAFSFLELYNIVTMCWNGQFTFLSPPLYFKIFFIAIGLQNQLLG